MQDRRTLWSLITVVVIVCALAWAWTVNGAGMGMSAVEMTRMAGMDGWLMKPAVWDVGYFALVFSMWWIMMVAMMLPSALPMLMLYGKAVGGPEAGTSYWSQTGSFAGGYLLIWGAFSLLATAMQQGLEAVRLMSPMMETTNHWLGAGILIAAGAWQLTPLKAVCLKHCRSPLGFFLGHWRGGAGGALRMGLEHGFFCLGCCWFLMLLLFFGGVMNLYWIIGLTVFVIVEKVMPMGAIFGKLLGVVLLGWGCALLTNLTV